MTNSSSVRNLAIVDQGILDLWGAKSLFSQNFIKMSDRSSGWKFRFIFRLLYFARLLAVVYITFVRPNVTCLNLLQCGLVFVCHEYACNTLRILPFQASSSDRVTVDLHTGTLHINAINMADEGNYACTVNTVGHQPIVSSNAHLYVES
jgi:hypothetical protein